MAADASANDTTDVDDQALTLRRQGKSFGTIADTLGLERVFDANQAFNRAVRRLPAEERAAMLSHENQRLDRLADSVRAHASLSAEEADKRLRTIERMRNRLRGD